MFIQIKTHNDNTRELSVMHINAAQIGTIQFGENDTSAAFTVGPDAFTTKDPDSIKALRTMISSISASQTDIDRAARFLAYQAQDNAMAYVR